MEKLFGIEMNVLAGWLFGSTVVILLVVLFLALQNRVLLKLALRNIPRRKAQTVLIIVGLMLSTTIIMSALAIGDTVASSIRRTVLDAVGDTDIRLTSPVNAGFGDEYLDEDIVARVRTEVRGDSRVDGVLPLIREELPVFNAATDKTVAGTSVVGIPLDSLDGFDSLRNTNGDPADLRGLREGEIIINSTLAEKIEADIDDQVTLVAPSGRSEYRVADIVESKGLAGGTEEVRSAALLPISSLQRALGREGQYNVIEVSVVGGLRVDEQISEDLADELAIAFTNDAAAEALFRAFKSPVIVAALKAALEDGAGAGGPFSSNTLAELVEELEKDSPSDEFKNAVTNTIALAVVAGVIEGIGDVSLAQSLLTPMSQLVVLQVDPIKNRGLQIAEFIGSFFTLIFSIFGSFSIIVGLLLIFLVFVMLAASRTTEMGIIRAVGTKRRHLVQMFVYEGIVYSIGAAALGTALGLVASVLLVLIMSNGFAQEETFSFSYGVTLQSIVIAFSAGLFITALTVSVSAYRVSKLNIVVAIRGLGQEFVSDETPSTRKRLITVLKWVAGPVTYLIYMWKYRRPDRSYRFIVLWTLIPGGLLVFAYDVWKTRKTGRGIVLQFAGLLLLLLIIPIVLQFAVLYLLLLIIPWQIVIVWKIYKLFQPWLASGWPIVPIGAVMTLSGLAPDRQVLPWGLESAALWSVGVTLIIIGIGLSLRRVLDRRGYREEFQKRVSMTLIGAAMLIFWGLPFDALENITGELGGGPEMFLLSGVSMVAAAVWVIMHNADIIVWVVSVVTRRFGNLRPVVKMAIAYPMAARFRTGLTLAMFSLVIFTLMIFAILNNLGNVVQDEPDLVSGGFDIRAEIERELPIDDPADVIAASGGQLSVSDFTLITAQARLRVEARQDGVEDLGFKGARVRASDETWLTNNRFELTHWDPSYGSTSEEIWAAVAADPTLAVVNGNMIETGGFGGDEGFGGTALSIEGVVASEPGEMEAVDITIRPPIGQRGGGKSVNRKIIGVLDQFADAFDFGSTDVYMNSAVLEELSDKPVPFVDYKFRLADGSRANEITRLLETVFIEHGMTANAIEQEIKDNQAQNNAFNQLFQGFMGLGLLVGVASLGVVSFRAVVERRQSIGMMRALGFKGRMIEIQFLMESGVVAVLGSALGIVLGTWIAWNIFNEIRSETQGVTFTVPWLNVTIIVLIAVVFSLVATFIPARQASKIKPSAALRYE